jgi:hypothetical protein
LPGEGTHIVVAETAPTNAHNTKSTTPITKIPCFVFILSSLPFFTLSPFESGSPTESQICKTAIKMDKNLWYEPEVRF